MQRFLSLLFLFFTTILVARGQDTTIKKDQPFWKKISLPKHDAPPVEPPAESILPIDSGTNKVSYSEVIEVKKAAKSSLFSKAEKWIATRGSTANPYSIVMESEAEGSLIAKGTFTLPAQKRKYVVQFVISIGVKQGKYRYQITDFVVQLETQEGGKAFGYGGFSSHSVKKAEVLEYTLETFYPSRLRSNKPVVKFFEGIDATSFAAIDREMVSLSGSLKETVSRSGNADW